MAQIVHDLAPGARSPSRPPSRRSLRQRHPGLCGGRRQGDRRRRRLLRRAVLPGRAGRRRDRRSGGRRCHLPLRGRQRQPDRRGQRDRLLGNAEIPRLGTAVRPNSGNARAPPRPLHGLQPEAGQEDDTFGITVEGRNADRRPAVGRTVVRGRNRPRRLPARQRDEPLSPVEGGTSDNIADTKCRSRYSVGKTPTHRTGSPARDQPLLWRRSCNKTASTTAKPRVKVRSLENGGGVSETEYPKSAGGDVVGPTVFGHAAPARSASAPSLRRRLRSRALLLARPRHPLLRPGQGTVPAPALARQTISQARPGRHRLRADHLLRPARSRAAIASAGPPRRRPTPRPWPPWCCRPTRRSRRPDQRRPHRDRQAGAALRCR